VTNIRDAEAIATTRPTALGRSRRLLGHRLRMVKLQRRLSQHHTASHRYLCHGEHLCSASQSRSSAVSSAVIHSVGRDEERSHFVPRPDSASQERADGWHWLTQPQPHRQPHFSETRASNLGVCVPTIAQRRLIGCCLEGLTGCSKPHLGALTELYG